MKNLVRNKEVQKILFQLVVGGFVTVLIWVGISVYSAWVKETDVKVDKTILKPITANFDVDTLKKLETRQTLPKNVQLETKEASRAGRQE